MIVSGLLTFLVEEIDVPFVFRVFVHCVWIFLFLFSYRLIHFLHLLIRCNELQLNLLLCRLFNDDNRFWYLWSHYWVIVSAVFQSVYLTSLIIGIFNYLAFLTLRHYFLIRTSFLYDLEFLHRYYNCLACKPWYTGTALEIIMFVSKPFSYFRILIPFSRLLVGCRCHLTSFITC